MTFNTTAAFEYKNVMLYCLEIYNNVGKDCTLTKEKVNKK